MSEADTELLAAVARVVAAFDALGVDFLIGGSVADMPTRTNRSDNWFARRRNRTRFEKCSVAALAWRSCSKQLTPPPHATLPF